MKSTALGAEARRNQKNIFTGKAHEKFYSTSGSVKVDRMAFIKEDRIDVKNQIDGNQK